MAYYMAEIRRLRQEFLQAYQDGEYKKAILLGKHLLDIYEENDDCECMDYAIDMHNLATVFERIQSYERALIYYKKAEELKKQHGGETLSYADTLNNLAIVYNRLGKHAQALKLHCRVLELRQKQLGQEHADVIYSLYHIGNSHELLGNWDKAIGACSQAVQQARRCPDFPELDLADLYAALGRVFDAKGNYRKSIHHFELCLTITEKARGQESFPYVLCAMLLVLVYDKAGWMDLAIEYAERAVELRRGLLSEKHLDFINALNTLAGLCAKGKRFEQAIRAHREVLELAECMLGKEHELSIGALYSLSMDEINAGDTKAALALGREALRRNRQSAGERSPQAASALMNLGDLYRKAGKYPKAWECYRQAGEIRKALTGDATLAYADTLTAMGRLAQEQSRLSDAEQYLAEAVAWRKQHGDLQSDAYVQDLQLLAELNSQQGAERRAINLSKEAVDMLEKRLYAGHPRYAAAVEKMALICEKAGYRKEAAAMLEGVATLRKEMLDEDNPLYLATLEQLAAVYIRLEEYEKAIALYQEKNDANFEETETERLSAANNLLAIANCYQLAGDAGRAAAYFREAEEKLSRCGVPADELYARRREQFLAAEQGSVSPEEKDGYRRALERCNAQALWIRERDGETADFARLLLKMASYHAKLGDRADTEQILDQVLRLGEKENGETPALGRLCDRVGRMLAQVGSMEKAEAALRRAYRLQTPGENCMTREGAQLLLRLLRKGGDQSSYLTVKNGGELV